METDKSEFGGSVYGLTNFRLILIGNYRIFSKFGTFLGTIAGSGAKYGGEMRGYPCEGCMCIRWRGVKHGVSNAATGDCARIPE
jgi:hypothetical protein